MLQLSMDVRTGNNFQHERDKKKMREVLILLMLLLAVLGFATWYCTRPHPKIVYKYDTMDCDLDTTTDEHASFFYFTYRYGKQYFNHTWKCRALANFVSHHRMKGCVHGPVTAKFGVTWFADWSFDVRARRAVPPGNPSFDPLTVRWTIDERPPQMLFPNMGIEFHDACGLSWNIRWVLSRLEECGLYKTLSLEWTGSDWNSTSTEDDTCTSQTQTVKMLPLREIFVGGNSGINTTNSPQFLESWLKMFGPVVTTIAVPDHFYDYTGGVFSKCDCKPRGLFALVHVVVLGYGTDEISGLSYWTIWPIGEEWKRADWGLAGTMKLEMGACVPDGLNLKMVVPVRDST